LIHVKVAQIPENRCDTWLIRIRTIAVGSTAERVRTERPTAVTIFGVEVVGSGLSVWILDFIDYA
jgi:hypothetical protein